MRAREFIREQRELPPESKDPLRYTYTLPGDAYPIFNIDFVWFLVNLIHQLESVLRKFPNTEYSSIIMDTIGLCKKIVIELKLNLIIGLCQNNYATPVLIDNLEYLGGYGISITFPSNPVSKLCGLYSKNSKDILKGLGGFIKLLSSANEGKCVSLHSLDVTDAQNYLSCT